MTSTTARLVRAARGRAATRDGGQKGVRTMKNAAIVAAADNLGQDDRLDKEEAMDLLCVCGARMPYLFDAFDCLTCGRGCCPDWAVLIESAWYCARGSASLLGVGHRGGRRTRG